MPSLGEQGSKKDEEDYQKQLVTLHNDTAAFIKTKSAKILSNYKSSTAKKFNRTCKPSDKKYLSATAICAFAITQFEKIWRNQSNSFWKIEDYWTHITNVLSLEVPLTDIEAPDEFTILNITPLLLEIGLTKNDEKKDFFDSNNGIIRRIVFSLCNQFILNQFKFKEKAHHPFLYYRFLKILQNWKKVLPQKDQEMIAIKVIKKFGTQIFQNLPLSDEQEKKAKDFVEKLQECTLGNPTADIQKQLNVDYINWCFEWFLNEIYSNGKHELYRQFALYEAKDWTLFDVKRLVYSLLIVCWQGKYSNDMVIREALRIIFEKQYETGLLPISHVVDNDFVMINGNINPREVSAVPLLLSFECFTDLLSETELEKDLKGYERNFRLSWQWAEKRLRRRPIPDGKSIPLGWYPEYESTHVPESWVAAHVLLFIKKYHDLLYVLTHQKSAEEQKGEDRLSNGNDH